MSYELTDGRESRGQFASNGGYSDLIRYVRAHAASFPSTKALLEAGESTQVAKVHREVTQPTLKPPADVASTMTILGQLLHGVKRAVISDGLTSGNSVDAYSPDEPRDKNGEWTNGGLHRLGNLVHRFLHHNNKDDKRRNVDGLKQAVSTRLVTLYHGTADDLQESILKQGLLPQVSKSGDAWASLHMGAVNPSKAKRNPSVYVTTDLHTAMMYASMAADVHNAHPVLLKIRMPETAFKAQFRSDTQSSSSAFRTEQPLPREWIKGIAVGHVDHERVMTTAGRLNAPVYSLRLSKFKTIAAAAAVTLYMVVMLAKDVKAYSEAEPRDKDGKWTTGGDSATTIHYAKNLRFPKIVTDAAWRAELQNTMTAAVAKYAASPNYDDAGITKWMAAYDQLRGAGAPEDKATLMKAAEGNGVYPEAAASMGMVPLQVKYAYDDIVRWTADDYEEFANSVQKVIDGATDADPAMALEYAHTQAALQQRLTRRNQPTDAVNLYRGLRTDRDGFNGQVAALKELASASDWSVTWKTSGAESWTPDKDKAYQYKGNTGIILGTKIPVAHVMTAEVVNPQAFSAQPTEQEYIVAHPKQLLHISKKRFELVAAADVTRILQAVETLRASGWKVTVDGKNIVLEEPHSEINWLHDRRKKTLNAKAHKLDGKTVFQGLPISIENKVGSTRSGTKPDGTAWSVVMPFDYGYIRGTVGEDGDHVDCFIGPVWDAKFAYVIHQSKQDSEKYDEDKVMLGFKSADAAKKAYSSAYDDGVGLMSSMSVLPMSTFIAKVKKTKDRSGSKKIHAGDGHMDLVAHADLNAGGPGSGNFTNHPSRGGGNHAAVEEWLKSHGYEQHPNDKTMRGERLWFKTVSSENYGGVFDNRGESTARHAVTLYPDGSWSHTVDGSHSGTDLGTLNRVAGATNTVARKTRTGSRIVPPGSVVRQRRVLGRGKGLNMLQLHMHRIGLVKE